MVSHQRQLVLAVEGTAALGQSWNLLRSEYVDKIVRAFHGTDGVNQKNSGSLGEMALIVFYNHGPHSGCLLQQTGWTTNLDMFLQWLSCISFVGGGFGEAAIAEGLAEALWMCCPNLAVSPVSQVIERQKHCILVTASNPHRLPTPVPRPAMHALVQPPSTGESPAEHWWLADADAIAKAFSQCLVSLSVIAPRQLPILKSIYQGGRRNPRGTDAAIDPIKYPQHMVLLSENFMEARVALSRAAGTTVNSSSVAPATIPKIEPVSLPATSVAGQTPGVGIRASVAPPVGTVTGRPSTSNVAIPSVAVKTEGSSVTTLASATGLTSASILQNSGAVPLSMQHPPPCLPNQDQLQSNLATDTSGAHDFKNLQSSTTQALRAAGVSAASVNLLTNTAQARQIIGSATLSGTNTLGIQSAPGAAAGLPVSSMMSSSSASASVSTAQSALGIGQTGLSITNNSVGLGAGIGMGQGNLGVGLGGFSGTASLAGNTSLGVVQPAASGNSTVAGVQGVVGLGQTVTGLGQGSITGGTQLGSGHGMSHNVLAGLGAVGVSSGGGTMIPTPGLPQQVQGLSSLGVANTGTLQVSSTVSSVPNPLQQVPAVATPPQQATGTPSKYAKLWEGILTGQRKQMPVPICKLEAYRQPTSPDTLASDWPSTMQICRLIPQDHMNSKNYQGKSEVLVFRPLSQHGFLVQLAEKKLCAVIQLPSQTLLLASSDKPGRMIGMLFPGDMVVFKPQQPSQQQVQGSAPGIGQSFSQGQLPGQARPQLMQQGQPPGQGAAGLSGSGFLP